MLSVNSRRTRRVNMENLADFEIFRKMRDHGAGVARMPRQLKCRVAARLTRLGYNVNRMEWKESLDVKIKI